MLSPRSGGQDRRGAVPRKTGPHGVAPVQVAFLGTGNLAQRVVEACLRDSILRPDSFVVTARRPQRIRELADLGWRVEDNLTAVAEASTIVVGVQPAEIAPLLAEVRPRLGPEKLLVTLTGGATPSALAPYLPPGTRLVCASMHGYTRARGLIALCASQAAGAEDLARVRLLVGPIANEFMDVTEAQLDAVAVFYGCLGAQFFLFVEGVLQGARFAGVAPALARDLALAAVASCVDEMRLTEEHPAVLRDSSCTPGGLAVAGIQVLERRGARSAVADAMAEIMARVRALQAKPADP